MRIRTCSDFQIQCFICDKWQHPDCAVRIAVKRLLVFIIVHFTLYILYVHETNTALARYIDFFIIISHLCCYYIEIDEIQGM